MIINIALKNHLNVDFFLDNPLAVISKGIFYLQSTDLLFDKFKINTSKSDKEIRRVQRTG